MFPKQKRWTKYFFKIAIFRGPLPVMRAQVTFKLKKRKEQIDELLKHYQKDSSKTKQNKTPPFNQLLFHMLFMLSVASKMSPCQHSLSISYFSMQLIFIVVSLYMFDFVQLLINCTLHFKGACASLFASSHTDLVRFCTFHF